MLFSSTAEYALRAVVHLALHADGLCSSREIASGTRSPPRYVAKVLRDLVRAGVITARRGPSGGFGLARPAAAISVLDVVNAVDPVERITVCPLGLPSHGERLCRMHQTLDEAIAGVERALARATIADMLLPSDANTRCLYPTIDGDQGA